MYGMFETPCCALIDFGFRHVVALSGGAAVVSEDTLNDKEKARTGQGMSEDEVAHEPGAALREAESERRERGSNRSMGRRSQPEPAAAEKGEQASCWRLPHACCAQHVEASNTADGQQT